ncbi:MAG: hypothetical protein DVB23_002560 [Verrucomicrobia bacterium]|jgi:hypothetical protein|nr:MAG: hypothetical protein DVB23_002560 [Verrucomicrobiota bacterium]
MRCFPFLALALAFLLSGCTTVSGPDQRIAQNPAWYSELKQEDQLLIRQGRIREGMGKNAVFLAWGNPDSVTTGTDRGKPVETWTYLTYQPQFVSGFGMGVPAYYGMGYYGYGPGVFQDVIYTQEPAAMVQFENSRVVAWQARR